MEFCLKRKAEFIGYGGDRMKIKVLLDNKKGASTLLENHFELIKDIITTYPNALWRKCTGKNGQQGYEIDVR